MDVAHVRDCHLDGESEHVRVCLRAFISAVPRERVNVTSLTNVADPAAAGQPFRGCDRLRVVSLPKGVARDREKERERERNY